MVTHLEQVKSHRARDRVVSMELLNWAVVRETLKAEPVNQGEMFRNSFQDEVLMFILLRGPEGRNRRTQQSNIENREEKP